MIKMCIYPKRKNIETRVLEHISVTHIAMLCYLLVKTEDEDKHWWPLLRMRFNIAYINRKCVSTLQLNSFLSKVISSVPLRNCTLSTCHIPSNLQYKTHQITKLNCSSSRLAVVFVHYIEARRSVDNEDVVGAAPEGDAPTTSEWSTISLSTRVRLMLEVLRYIRK